MEHIILTSGLRLSQFKFLNLIFFIASEFRFLSLENIVELLSIQTFKSRMMHYLSTFSQTLFTSKRLSRSIFNAKRFQYHAV